MKIKSIRLLVLIFFGSISISQSNAGSLLRVNSVQDIITVGTKLSDSSGIVTISNSMLQTAIINRIPYINNLVILNQPAVISIGSIHSYILFKANRSNTTDTLLVALEINLSTGNTLIFQNNKSGLQLFTSQVRGSCSVCEFLHDKQNSIGGARCSAVTVTDPKADYGCRYSMYYTD